MEGKEETFREALRRKVISGLSQGALRSLSFLDRKLYDSSLYEMQLADPYKALGVVRSRGPVLRSLTYQGWLVTGYGEVTDLLHHEKMSSDLRNNAFMVRLVKSAVGSDRVATLDDPTMLNQDPPAHTRLRKLVNQVFTHKFVMGLEPGIQEVCDRLLANIKTGEFDLVKSFAKPLPAIVIARLLGVPEKDYERFQAWSADLLSLTRITQPEMMRRSARATEEMSAYFAGLVEEKRKTPGEDLISELIRVEEGDKLTRTELHSLCMLLLVAGHETTTRLIGNGLLLFMEHPQQMSRLRQTPGLMDNAIEEVLRFQPPLQFTPRLVKQPFTYKGCHMKPGQATLLSIAAANRDPAANEDPDCFDIERSRIKHVTFGHGPHLCLGMSLARLEAKIAFRSVLEKFPRLALLDAGPQWSRDFFFRGLQSLRLVCK